MKKKHETGASLVEYTLLVALIAIAAIIAVSSLGTAVGESFGNSGKEFKRQTGATSIPGGGGGR